MFTALRIVGQGLAGSLLGWACECAELPFEMIDRGHGAAASRVAAGMINPITGQRLVKSWRIEELLPRAVRIYQELEVELGERFLFPMRVRRIYRNPEEREVAQRKLQQGELAPYVLFLDEEGFWIESAYRVDTLRLIERLRERWIAAGKLVERLESADTLQADGLTVWCRGAGELKSRRFDFARLSPAKGEILEVKCEKLDTKVILSDRHWVLPLRAGQARVGATFEPGCDSLEPTIQARAALSESACRLIGPGFEITGHEVGLRVTTPDKHPVVGRHPVERGHGIINGLGSKGALLAPWLAEQWIAHLTRGASFDAAVDLGRFF